MKILHTADWHIGSYKGPEKDGVNMRYTDIINCLNYMVEKAKEIVPDLIIVSGDIFNVAKEWCDRAIPEVMSAINIITELSNIAPVYVLHGTLNHDGYVQFDLLKDYFKSNPNVTIMCVPTVKVIETKAGKVNIAGLPAFDRGVFRTKFPGLSKEDENLTFTRELGNMVVGLRAMCDEKYPSILVSHYTVPGANMESGQTAFFGQSEPMLMPETLDAAKYDLIALGHIHRPQRIESVSASAFYSGAINALNFNDEGQTRGFWIHEIGKESDFIETPIREFETIRLNADDIHAFNSGAIESIAQKWRGLIENCIVRVLYTCTDEDSKALNRDLLTKALYLDGAFYVAGIMPESVIATASKEVLAESGAPEELLKQYLTDKEYSEDKIQQILAIARPIIESAESIKATASIKGVFEPVSIAVKNYRNYVEETFDFTNITFCTVNGQNGAGKSSLFMDAILDCLYEEPREGSLTVWIRQDDDAKSGSITFTFKIGKRTFRVTRTRTKSGKATLNISELIEDDWTNCSKEKLVDTQAEIVRILGMDSTTIKSCALIMQDGYGLFLEKDKETRMSILGNLLGIGVYSDMEKLARQSSTDVERERRKNQDEIQALSETLADEKAIQQNINDYEKVIQEQQKQSDSITIAADNVKLKLNTKAEAEARSEKLSLRLTSSNGKKATLQTERFGQDAIIKNADTFISTEDSIMSGVATYHKLLEQEKSLIGKNSTFETKKSSLKDIITQMSDAKSQISKLEAERITCNNSKDKLSSELLQEEALRNAALRYADEKTKLTTMEEKSSQYVRLSNNIMVSQKDYTDAHSIFKEEGAVRVTQLNGLNERAKLLDNSGCIDAEKAHCKFLQDAVKAKSDIAPYKAQCTKWKEGELQKLAKLKNKCDELKKERDALAFDGAKMEGLRKHVTELEALKVRYDKLNGAREQIKLLNNRISDIDKESSEKAAAFEQLQAKKKQLDTEISELKDSVTAYETLKCRIEIEKQWLEKEKELPVMKERKAAAQSRISAIDKEIAEIEVEISSIQSEYELEKQNAEGTEQLKNELSKYNNDISAIQANIQNYNMQIGGYKETLDAQKITKSKIDQMQKDMLELANKVSIYEELKKAFSQNGIPHDIIKSILPTFAETANNILSQMSGGLMSVEFVTEKLLKSNTAKEIETLDVLIEENGKALPYLSRSGGEKVKSALSIILALAEIRSNRAGVQFGMLFIDEPPFLDSDGTQAYCDALETISRRYSDLKVMAITHDPEMKARFPQSVDIVKDQNGSHVNIL